MTFVAELKHVDGTRSLVSVAELKTQMVRYPDKHPSIIAGEDVPTTVKLRVYFLKSKERTGWNTTIGIYEEVGT